MTAKPAAHLSIPNAARLLALCLAVCLSSVVALAQEPAPSQTAPTPAPPDPARPAQTPAQAPASQTPPNQAPSKQNTAHSVTEGDPIALVPIDAASGDQGATVTGALRVAGGKAIIATNGSVTSASRSTDVVLPRRGVLRVCASTSVHLSTDSSVPAGETPGLMMAIDHGAVEASFATGQNSDILLTPDFRILIGGPGAADVKVRLGQHGDTCVDNAGSNAPYVLVSSVFEGGAYRVQPGQRVMFQHGSLKEVVDQEKEPCGCPAEARPGTNDFPLAQSAGLAPLPKSAEAPKPEPQAKPQPAQELNVPLVYSAPPPATAPAAEPAQPPVTVTPATQNGAAATPAKAKPAQKKPGFFHGVGRFFRRIFGAE